MPIAQLLDHFNREDRVGQGRQPQAPQTLATAPFDLLENGRVEAEHAGIRLGSAFQPIVDANSGRLIGHEALLRPRRDRDTAAEAVPPEAFFARFDEGEGIVRLDRLCRILHTLNFSAQQPIGGDLFINVHPRHLLAISGEHGAFFESVLRRCGLAPERVVIEILESSVDDLSRLQAALASYQRRGFRIAIDDFGCRHSNFDRLWQLRPDIVKLDRSLIVAASEQLRVRRILPRLVDIIHELDAVTVVEGIETADQLTLARDSGADAVQGYLLGRPAPLCTIDALKPAARQRAPSARPRTTRVAA
jgi:EAL domain-containing protein (putative c-di-GMP-specific phosphodiesterase class I)